MNIYIFDADVRWRVLIVVGTAGPSLSGHVCVPLFACSSFYCMIIGP